MRCKKPCPLYPNSERESGFPQQVMSALLLKAEVRDTLRAAQAGLLRRTQTMGVNKKYHEFSAIDMNSGWETLPGYPEGIQQKILSGALDEINKRGTRTRLLRFAPGAFTHPIYQAAFPAMRLSRDTDREIVTTERGKRIATSH
jgi:hypothetical protein